MRRGMRRRCEAIVRSLGLPDAGLDIPELSGRVEDARGVRIVLSPADTRHIACGAAITLETHTVVRYAEATSPMHQAHIVCHELGHLLLGHKGVLMSETSRAALTPDLDPAVVARMLARDQCSDEDEQAAEYLGRLLARRLHRISPLPMREEVDAPAAVLDLLRALGDVL
jgi:IrrE N-terminal-like domain